MPRHIRAWKSTKTTANSATSSRKSAGVITLASRPQSWTRKTLPERSSNQLRSLCRSRSCDFVLSGAGVLQPAIGGAGGLAGARPLNALHLPGAARNLILIHACLKCAISHRPSGLVGVENLVTAVKRFHVDARHFAVVFRNFSVLRKHTLFARCATHFSLRRAFSRRQRKEMADLVTGSDTLLAVGLAAPAGGSEFRLRRGHRRNEGNHRKTAQNLKFHFRILHTEIRSHAYFLRFFKPFSRALGGSGSQLDMSLNPADAIAFTILRLFNFVHFQNQSMTAVCLSEFARVPASSSFPITREEKSGKSRSCRLKSPVRGLGRRKR